MIEELGKLIADMLYPKRCPVCEEIVLPKGQKAHCECKKLLNYIKEPRCKKCSKSIENEEEELCYDCSKNQFQYVQGFALWEYDKRMQKSIASFKYKGKREYVSFYAEELLLGYEEKIRKIAPDILVPIPIHYGKLQQRGFNQAELIAKAIAKKLEMPMWNHFLIRSKATKPQKGLNDKDRVKNLEDAFNISKKHKKSENSINKVLLIDDIYTTGSTIETCTRVLMKYGVKEVYFISLCIGRGY